METLYFFLSFTALGMVFLSTLFLCFLSLFFVVKCGLLILREIKEFSKGSKDSLFSPCWGRTSIERRVVPELKVMSVVGRQVKTQNRPKSSC